jgi:ribosomal protein S18 acetylase RimI-like enzyme
VITLRPSTPDSETDHAFTWAVKEAALRPYVEGVWGWDEAVQRGFHARDWETCPPHIIMFDGAPVGTIAIHRDQSGASSGLWHFGEFYIVPEFQKRGIGGNVLEGLIAEAAANGCGLRLEVIKINPAKRLYDRYGFQVTGETVTHYLMERPYVRPV